jgi:hypothetical protein
MVNNIFSRFGSKNLPTEEKEEFENGILTIKSVLYDKDNNEVVMHRKDIVVADEIEKIDRQIEALQAKKENLAKYE